MRTILFFALFLSLASLKSASAQTPSDSTKIDKYVYCELIGMQKLLSTKVNVSVDYGEETRLFQDTRMKDEQTGKVRSFNSMVDALNYMANNGWEFVQAYVVTNGQQNVYRWLLKMKIENKPITLKPK